MKVKNNNCVMFQFNNHLQETNLYGIKEAISVMLNYTS
jgi:hypothetical protein